MQTHHASVSESMNQAQPQHKLHRTSNKPELLHLPDWLRKPIGKSSDISRVQQIIKQRRIHTICEEGRCPNRGECYSKQTATFLLMGATCTRACAFCQVDKGHAPMTLDPHEPEKVAESVKLLDLKYVVLTSVARDDLPDHGASWFVRVMEAIRDRTPQTQIEVLTPDFWGDSPQKRARQSVLRRLWRRPQPALTTTLKQYGGCKVRCGEALSMSDRCGCCNW